MPRLLLAMALALPFIVRNTDDAGGGGAAVTPGPETDVWEDLRDGGDSPEDAFGENSPFGSPALVDPSAPLQTPAEEEAAKAAEEAAAAPAVPETLDVDGTDVPVADLLEAYKGRSANADLLEAGNTYAGAMQVFDASPEGARSIIEAMITAAREVHGDTAVVGLGVPDALPEEFDAETATPNERALVAQNAALQRKIADQQKTYQRTLDELKPIATDHKLQQAGAAYAATVNAQFPAAKVDAAAIVKMMRETGLDDPVKAYKLATYDTAVDAARNAEPKEKQKDLMPRPGAAKTFDPKGPDMTVDKIVRLMDEGYVPIGG